MVSASPPHATALPATEVAGPRTTLAAPRIAAALLVLLSVLGIAFAYWLRTVPAGMADPRLTYNVFYYLFAHNEPAGLTLVLLFNVAALFLLRRPLPQPKRELAVQSTSAVCIAIAAVVFAICAIGVHLVFHDYLLTADENLADFQAKIFMRGKIQAQVPPALWDAVRVIKPTFVDYFPATHSWNATYYPVYSAIRALFQLGGLQNFLNPALAGLTLFALFGVARRVWPNDNFLSIAAVLLMATSPQFLLMSMTAYSMPAHLAFNTIWLWLYSQPERRGFYFAPVVGVFAIGLHEPIVHALFVLPFLVRLVLQRRWRPTFIFAIIYVGGCLLWLQWRFHFQAPSAGSATDIFKFRNPRIPIIQSMNLLLIIGWASLATPLLAALGFTRFRRLPPFLQDCVLSCALTFGFYFLYFLDQAHGWGYRYFHGTLSCLVLVAVAGLQSLANQIEPERLKQLLIGGAVAAILIQLPLRAIEAERFVRPYAQTAATLHAVPAEMVAVDARHAWYSADLIRNDPFVENRPVMVSIYGLNSASVAALEKVGRVRFVDRDVLTHLGMYTEWHSDFGEDPFLLGRGK
jgi:hypothetical protein